MIATLGAALALGGCAGVRDSVSSGLMESATGTAFGPKPVTPAPFVTASRPANLDYIPVGVTPPQRSVKPKTKAEVAATEAQMLGEGQRQQALGAATEQEGRRVLSTPPKAPAAE